MTAEFDLIDLIAKRAGPPRTDAPIGIGDDAAVLDLPPGQQLVATMDTLNAGVHFFPDADPYRLGHKSLAVNLSDLASMGAQPRWLLLSLSMPSPDTGWLRPFIDGFLNLAAQHGAQLVGGDTCKGPLAVTVTALGAVVAEHALRRNTARPGDFVVVSGEPGLACLALDQLQRGREPTARSRMKLERPEPRVALGRALLGMASACIDLSDGLLADLGHLANSSGCGAEIKLENLPVPEDMSALDQMNRWALQLGGGDDYELCFTVSPDRANELGALGRELDLPLTVIGRMTTGSDVRCLKPGGGVFQPAKTGHEHFGD